MRYRSAEVGCSGATRYRAISTFSPSLIFRSLQDGFQGWRENSGLDCTDGFVEQTKFDRRSDNPARRLGMDMRVRAARVAIDKLAGDFRL